MVDDRLEPVAAIPPAPIASSGPQAVTLQRCAWTLVWFSVLGSGLGFWGWWTSWPPAAILAPVLIVGSMVGMAAVWLVDNPTSKVMQAVTLVAALVSVALPQGTAIHVRQFFTTDSAAFNQVASLVLLHGKNPYTASMAPAAKLLNTPANYWSYTVGGGHVLSVSYPAGSFLLQTPLMWLGFRHEVTDWMDLGAWLISGLLLFVLLPASVRWLSLFILMTATYAGMFSNGGTDALFVPFLILAVWRWDRFATGRGAGLAGWVGPLALGLACSIKQTPWFCVPFLVVGVALEARRSGRSAWTAPRYLAIVVIVFAAVNLPFILWGSHAWVKGTLIPFSKGLVADGQGLVTLAIHGSTGGVLLPLLSVAAALAFLGLMAAYVTWYPRMRRVWLFLLPAVLFIPGRSLASYLLDFFPAAVVAAATLSGPAALATGLTPVRRWMERAAVVVPLAAAVAVAVVAFNSAPLKLAVVRFHTSNKTQGIDSVTVSVHNLTDHRVTPHFMVALNSAHPSGFWAATTRSGPLTLAPGATGIFTIRPSQYTWSPIRGAYWMVEAYTSSPNALSTSPVLKWRLGKVQ
jgi:uncharacterized membrane protein